MPDSPNGVSGGAMRAPHLCQALPRGFLHHTSQLLFYIPCFMPLFASCPILILRRKLLRCLLAHGSINSGVQRERHGIRPAGRRAHKIQRLSRP